LRKFLTVLIGLLSVSASAQLVCRDGSIPYIPTTPNPSVVAIANDAEMDAALNNAKGGEVFQLADGNYSLSLANKPYPAEVTIQGSANAVVSAFAYVSNVSNLTIKGVTFKGKAAQAQGTYLLKPENTVNLKLIGVHFMGIDQTMTGVYPKTGTNVGTVFDGVEVANLYDGLTLGSFKNLVVRNSDFHGLGADSMKVWNSSNVLIEKNHVHDARHAYKAHPDFVQLQSGNSDVTIQDNLIEGATQGIDNFGFAVTPQTNIVVRRNTHIQANYPNFVGLNNVTGSITDNVIKQGTGGYPLIRYSGGISVSNNTITK